MSLYSEANKYFEEILKEENDKLNESLKKKRLKESAGLRKKLREGFFDIVPTKYFDQIRTIGDKASRADLIRGVKNLFSNEEIKFLSLLEPNFIDTIVDSFIKDRTYRWYDYYKDAYLLVKGSRDGDNFRWVLWRDGSILDSLTFEQLKEYYDKDPDRFRETVTDISIWSIPIKHNLDGKTYHNSLESSLQLTLPLAKQLAKQREIELKQAKEERKKPYVRGLNKAQNELLQDIKDYIADEEDTEDDLDSIRDTAYQIWDEGDIEIPASYVRSQGGDPDNVDKDIVESYFDDVLWNDKFKKAVLNLFQQLKTTRNESFKSNKPGKKRLKEAKHYNIKDLHLIYTVRELDGDGDVIDDDIKSFDNKEDAIRFAKSREYFVDVYLDTKEEIYYDDVIEGEGSEDLHKVVWTNYESLGDVLKRTTPENQAELLSYIEQNLKDSGDYYGDDSAKDIAYYEFVEGRGIDIIIPDAYVLSEDGDPDNVSDDIVDDYFDELWDNSLKKRIEDLLKKYRRR